MTMSKGWNKSWLTVLCAALVLGPLQAGLSAEIIKSPNDQRDYKAINLANQLRVVLISDPDTDKAAASLNVQVGSASDPEGREGMAHMLEHMLFLGTEKHPEPGEYKNFLSSHGGNHNAYTALFDTNYFLDVDKDYLEPALDRFAQFFSAPLFTAKYVQNERQVVHSEYQSKLRVDGWRIRNAQQQAMNPAHPASRFNIGSQETLADRAEGSIRQELIDFYQQQYSANLMTLVVLGKEPLEQLEQWVQKKFAAVPNHERIALSVEQPQFKPTQLPARLNVTPIKDEHSVSLLFPLPAVKSYYQAKPTQYISYILGYEGKGSLLSLLKQNGWANSLWAGLGRGSDSEASLMVSVDLTPSGVEVVDTVISKVFDTIQLMQSGGIPERLFDEQQRLAEIGFRFQETSEPISTVRHLAALMNDYPTADLLRGPYTISEYKPELIERFLGYLRPDNVMITVSSQAVATDKTAPWFDTPYQLSAVSPEQLQQWRDEAIDPALSIPAQNHFIPEQLSLQETAAETAAIPSLIENEAGLRLWHQLDTSFSVPRAEFYFSIRSPLANSSAKHTVLTELYVSMVKDQLGELSYPAYVAGLDYKVYKHMRGVSVRLSGFDEKQALLLSQILPALRQPRIDPAVFERIKDELQRNLLSARNNTPYHQTYREISDLLLTPQWSDQDQLAALNALTIADLQDFIAQFLQQLELVSFAYGNLSVAEARELGQQVRDSLFASAEPVTVPRGRLLKLASGQDFIRDLAIEHQDSALTMYLQGSDKSIGSQALFGLLAEYLESPFFEKLRTEEKLGYIVFSSAMPLLEVPALAFTVQSPSATPLELQEHIDRFLAQQTAPLEQLTEQDLTRLKSSLLSRLLAQDKTLQDRAERFWVEIDRENSAFDTREQFAQAVRDITLPQLISVYQNNILSEQARRRLIVRSLGQSHERLSTAADNLQTNKTRSALIADPAAFKQSQERFPG
jgi:secreted Zn-dependent insulinase-like peptidase